ncbi:PRD domain-containing protein [Hespellia stercorisuis]|uniref:Transcriptional antiterminator, BglG family n=1 Tax=Hespellia stercorisuis DSM 15480 TaxID=1121950 RepID=A0A1M6KCW2_9FIRM|nr:PRD domain-containing protein [Hespellia stercorisuis]SHJ56799.1 transcriptional antiterminator, BglG family [Hespellia stercorisuis DSM 15480]
MYRVERVLNHNTVIVIKADSSQEYLMMGKGVGFGRKVSERIEKRPEDSLYSLQEITTRGEAKNLVKSISPICLELADIALNEAEKCFGRTDRSALFPLADHLEFAIGRIQKNEQISNPLTNDIRVIFHNEYKVAQCLEPLILEKLNVKINEHETGYIALHIHSAIDSERVEQSMQTAQAVRDCITLVEQETEKIIAVNSLAYNRLMNHVRYMVARVLKGEKLKVSMNDYMEQKFPLAFETATRICDGISSSLKRPLDEIEIGYLAMHIERVADDERES